MLLRYKFQNKTFCQKKKTNKKETKQHTVTHSVWCGSLISYTEEVLSPIRLVNQLLLELQIQPAFRELFVSPRCKSMRCSVTKVHVTRVHKSKSTLFKQSGPFSTRLLKNETINVKKA